MRYLALCLDRNPKTCANIASPGAQRCSSGLEAEYVAPSSQWEIIVALRAILLCTCFLLMGNISEAATVPPVGHITGIGGVFFKAKDPKSLAAWYRDMLGLPIESWGGAALRYDAPKHPLVVGWNAFPAASIYFAPYSADFMINYAVDNMDAVLARLKSRNVPILKRDDKDPNGRFAWILDPEGNKVELWEPKR